MTAFQRLLHRFSDTTAVSTDDVLGVFLPLMRQVIAVHDQRLVAPLEGVAQLVVENGALAFDPEDAVEPRHQLGSIRRLLDAGNGGIQIVGRHARTTEIDSASASNADLSIAEPTETLQRPAYLPGYLCWEHTVQHHDPATDVFSLGLILASLACGVDLTDREEHSRFVRCRTNLFELNGRLHPVLARTIRMMTELDRHARPQNPAALLRTLENYRDHAVDFETDLAADQQAVKADRPGRRQVILNKLQERLFDISRRNRLLHFQSSMQAVNLSHASIPVMLSPEQIRSDQILTWAGRFRDSVLKGKPVSLNQFLNFREAAYLTGTLDRIRVEAKRDETEYGFAQLRLVTCFLRWANLKTQPAEQYESPLLLLPVRLDVVRGIHDRYLLTADDTTAEVNPVVRHLFESLYGISLPEEVNLTSDGLDQFCNDLQNAVTRQDASVHITQVTRPRIDLIHEKARRRLDQFRRRAGLSGRSVRQFMNVDYSYDSLNYHPLGIQLFQQWIAPPGTMLRELVKPSGERARGRRNGKRSDPEKPMTTEEDCSISESSTATANESEGSTNAAGDDLVEVEKQFYQVRTRQDQNPFNWELDLCSVTLANLKYRRMTLVRDYYALVTDNTENPAFEATFSIAPTDRSGDQLESLPDDQRFHVVSCDPTQSQAIAHARTGHSYIIQGPPGTGKSQTITNLIADYLARGKRILFVCEKRAAIDVVFHRLRQQQLHELCCLIHDSQADKKQFVMDLKQTYEGFLADATDHSQRDRRQQLIQQFQDQFRPLTEFNQAMLHQSEHTGISLRTLLDRLIELRDQRVELTQEQIDMLPPYAVWHQCQGDLTQLRERIRSACADELFCRHPLALLHGDLVDHHSPELRIRDASAQAEALISDLLSELAEAVPELESWLKLCELSALCAAAERLRLLAARDLLPLLLADSQLSEQWDKSVRRIERRRKELQKTQQLTGNWKQKLSA
ncbi:MAG: DUF4011 domain-containing protein, partial [Planctomycetaceae bacterium]|nr:DUF4011 domain-containing protein [Planctomycetaceae bacterium]